MRQDGDLIVDAGDVLSASRAIGMVWRDVDLDRLSPNTLDSAARLLRSGSSTASKLADRFERRATYMRGHRATRSPTPS